ncbi:MAG: choice-of-anchor Q domain-containing protein, partial [Pirellulales bacterium]
MKFELTVWQNNQQPTMSVKSPQLTLRISTVDPEETESVNYASTESANNKPTISFDYDAQLQITEFVGVDSVLRVKYRILHESAVNPQLTIYQVIDGVRHAIATPSVQSTVGPHTVWITPDALSNPTGDYTLIAEFSADDVATVERVFSGGAFRDDSDAWHVHGGRGANTVQFDSGDLTMGGDFDVVQHNLEGDTDTAYVRTAGQTDKIELIDVGGTYWFSGGLGNDTYIVRDSLLHNLDITLQDNGGLDTLNLKTASGHWAGVNLDLGATDKQTVATDGNIDLAVTFITPNAIDVVTEILTSAVTGRGYGLPILVGSLTDLYGAYAADQFSLREALYLANQIPAANSIAFDATLFAAGPATIALAGQKLGISSSVTINGPGADLLAISGGGATRVFEVAYNQDFTISGMSIIDGNAADESGPDSRGGAIYNIGGRLTFEGVEFRGNTAGTNGGVLYSVGGSLTIRNCTFHDNDADTGGAIYTNSGALSTPTKITNSTFSRNQSIGAGGAIYVSGGAYVEFVNDTVTDNTSGGPAGGIYASIALPRITLHNTIVAGNTGSGGVASDLGVNGFTTASSYNLIGVSASSAVIGNNNQIIGSADLGLAPLGDYGGPTKTHAPLPDSPAIDAASASVAMNYGLLLDQRGAGYSREINSHVDIGATEAHVIDDEGVVVIYGTSHADDIAISATDMTSSTLGTIPIDIAGATSLTIYGWEGDDKIKVNPAVEIDAILWGGAGDDTLHGGSGDDYLIGGDGDDRLYGGKGDDELSGEAGDDYLFGGEGIDTLSGGSDADVLFGQEGDDEFSGGDGDDIIYGGSGDDAIHGNADNDQLFGGEGNDDIHGDSGNDLLDGGAGTDSLEGGNDDDTYAFGPHDAISHTIVDIHGSNVLDFSQAGSAVTATLGAQATYVAAAIVLTGATIGRVIGSEHDDELTAPTYGVILEGRGGDDRLIGGAGKDSLLGGAGNDFLHAGPGDDELLGGVGDDTYIFEFDDVPELDIADIAGSNTLDFSLVQTSVVVQLGVNAVFDDADIDLVGVRIGRVIGSEFNDTLIGDAGDNELSGGAGNDTLIGGGGSDILLGEAGFDQLEVIDNADTSSGYTETSQGQDVWESTADDLGFNRGQRYSDADNANVNTTWTFADLPAGDYEVYVTWTPESAEALGMANIATNAQYSINSVNQSTVNQSQLPDGPLVEGRHWQHLGDLVTLTETGDIQVELSSVADGRVYADAVRIVRHFEPATVIVTSGSSTVGAQTDLSLTLGVDQTAVGEWNYSLMGNAPDSVVLVGNALTWDADDRPEGQFRLSVRAVDSGAPERVAYWSELVTLGDPEEQNENAPDLTITLNSIEVTAPVEIDEHQLLEFLLEGDDEETDPSNLRYSLGPGAPASAEIVYDNGDHYFRWTPTEDQDGEYDIAVRVTDSGNPPLRTTKVIHVTVNEVNAPPVIDAAQLRLKYDTGTYYDDEITADPTIVGVVTNDNGFEFVEIEVDYGYTSPNFAADGVVEVRVSDDDPTRGEFVIVPSRLQLPLETLIIIGVRAREWDPATNGYVYSDVEHIDITPDLEENDPPVIVNIVPSAEGTIPTITHPKLTGTVTNDGPVEGLTVLFYTEDYFSNPSRTSVGSVVTDADGDFEFVPTGLTAGTSPTLYTYYAVAEERTPLMAPGISMRSAEDASDFAFYLAENKAPIINSLELQSDTGADDDDNETSNPMITGQVSNPYGSVAGITIEFDEDGTPTTVEGIAVTDANGQFTYLPTSVIEDDEPFTINARAVEWDAYRQILLPGEWLESEGPGTEPLTFTLSATENAPPTLGLLSLKYGDEVSPVADPTIIGALAANDNGDYLGGILVLFSLNGADPETDRLTDIIGMTMTDAEGNFEFTPVGLPFGEEVTIYAQAVEWDADAWDPEGEEPAGLASGVQAQELILSDSPLAADEDFGFTLAYDTGEYNDDDVTADPTVKGTIIYAGDMSDVVVELDYGGDYTIDATITPNADGTFSHTPLGLVGLEQVIAARLRIRDFEVTSPEFENDSFESYSGEYNFGNNQWNLESLDAWFDDLIGEDGVTLEGDWYNSDFVRDWDSLFADYVTGWSTVTFMLDLEENELPEVDTFNYATDSQNPTVTGTVDHDDGNLAGLRVEVYYNGTLDGETFTEETGFFAYTAQGHKIGSNVVTIQVYEPRYGGGEYDEVPFVPTPPTKTIEVDSDLQVGSLSLVNGWQEDDDWLAIDPTLRGQIDVPGNLALRTVEFDIDGDGAPDGSTLSDGSGQFQFTPEDLEINVSNETAVFVRVIEERVDETTGSTYKVLGHWVSQEWQVVTNVAPEITRFELAYDTGLTEEDYEILDRVTYDPTLIGRVVDANHFAFVTVEFDHDSDNAVDGVTTTDKDGNFRYTPAGLTPGGWDIRARVQELNPVPAEPIILDSGWKSITADGDPETPSAFFGFTLVDPTSAPSVALSTIPTGPQLDPTITGSISSTESHPNAIIEFFLVVGQSQESIGSTNARADGAFSFTPTGLAFTPPETEHVIIAKAKIPNYFTGEFVEGSVSDSVSLEFQSSNGIAAQFTSSDASPSLLNLTVTGKVTVTTQNVAGVDFETVAPQHVEIMHGTSGPVVATVPVEAVVIDSATTEYRFSYQPQLPSPSTNVTIQARPVGADENGFVFGNWAQAIVSYDLEAPALDPDWILEGDIGGKKSITAVISGTVWDSEEDPFVDATAPLPEVEFDLDGDGIADDSATADAQGNFTYTFDGLTPGDIKVRARAVRFNEYTEDDVEQVEAIAGEWQDIEFELLTSVPRFATLALVNETGGPESGVTTDPTIRGTVASYATDSLVGITIEVDENLDGVADGTTVVRGDDSFEYTPRNLQPGPVTLRVRAIDPFTQNEPLVGEWTTLEFTLLAVAAPSPTNPESPFDLETFVIVNNQPRSSNPVLVGSMIRHETVTQLLVEFDQNGDGLVDGFTTADLLGQYSYTPQGLSYGTNTVRARGVAIAGTEIRVGEWSNPVDFFYESTDPPVVSGLTVTDEATGAISGRVTVGGFGRSAVVEIAVGISDDPPVTNGFAQTNASGYFTYQPRELAAGTSTVVVTVKASFVDSATGSELTGEEQILPAFTYNPPQAPTPQIVAFELAHDTGTSATDDVTADPTLRGTVTGYSVDLYIQFDHDADDDADGQALVRPDGSFEYVPQGLVDNQSYSIRAATKVWDSGQYLYHLEDFDASATPPVGFALNAAHNTAASVATLELRQNDSGVGQTPSSADPTFIGTVTNDGRRSGLVVEFDHNGDGVIDGTAVTNADGEFLYRAQGLSPSAVPQAITARVVEYDYFGNHTLSALKSYEFILSEAPLIDEIEYANDFDPPPATHTVQGVVLSSADPSDLYVEYQVFGNGTPFTPPPSLTYFEPDFEILEATVDPGNEFTINVSSLGLGAATVIMRAVDTSGATPLAGPWTHFNFTIQLESATPPDITGFALVEDTDGSNDTGSDGITSNPTVKGTVGSGGSGAYAVVEITVTITSGAPAQTWKSRVNADATGYFEFTPNLPVGAGASMTAHSVVYNPVTDAEDPSNETSAINITFIANETATIIGFEPVDETWETSQISDPTVKGQVTNDGRVSGLRIEFRHDESTETSGFAFTDEYGNFEYTPFGLSSGLHTIHAQVVEWDFETQEYAPTGFNFSTEEFDLSAAGPTEPEFDEQFAANLDVIQVADGGFKDALFSVLDQFDYASASGALDLGFGTVQLLHRAGGDAARDADIEFSGTIFDFTGGALPTSYSDNDPHFDVYTADGGYYEADFEWDRTVTAASETDYYNVTFGFTLDIDPGAQTQYERAVNTASSGDALDATLSLYGDYVFYFSALVYAPGGIVEGGSDAYFTETISYDYRHSTDIDSDPGTDQGPGHHHSQRITAGDYSYSDTLALGFSDTNTQLIFSYTETTRQETWIDEHGSESSDDGVHATSRTFRKQEHSLYVETTSNSGTISIIGGVQTINGTLEITATGDLTSDEWETVAYTNDYEADDHESGTHSSQSSGLYHGQLDATIEYTAGASMSSDATFTFSDHLSGTFQETGSGTSTIGETHETWRYAVGGSLGESLELSGTSSFTRDAGIVQRSSQVESHLTSQAHLHGLSGGETTYSTGDGQTYSDSGTAHGSFSFTSTAQYGESALATRVDDEYTITGAAMLAYSGSATQTGTVRGTRSEEREGFESDVDYAVREGARATASGGGQFTFTITGGGTQAAGSYHSTQSASSSRASQSAGTVTDTVENVTTPIRDNQAGTHSLDVTDRGTFTSGAGDLGLGAGGFENTRQGHATIVEVFTNRSASFAGLAGVLEEPPPDWEEDPIVIYFTGGSLDKGTYQRTITEDFDYEEANGQFAREGTISDVTERTADSLRSISGQDLAELADYASRRDGGWVATERFDGAFTEDAGGRRMSGVATGDEERHGATKDSYAVKEEDAQGEPTGNSLSSNSSSKFRRTGTSEGAVEIGSGDGGLGAGVVVGPINFTGDELSRLQSRGSSFRVNESSSDVDGVETKTLTAEGGTGHTQGEVTGHSSGTSQGTGGGAGGLGLGAGTSTANISATTDGNTGGNGFFISSAVVTGVGTKETELITSRGNDTAKSNGGSSGTIRTGRNPLTDLSVNGGGEGENEQTTRRVITSSAPGTRTHTSVTRTDTGDGHTNTNGTVTIEDGETERTGSFNGNSDNDATVTYTHRGNFALANQPKSYESADGVITSGVDV